jgi:Flp pilus assembly protein TadG
MPSKHGADASRSNTRGQSLAEFALVVPILAILLMALLQIGFLFLTQVGLTNAAREAARNAASIPVATVATATTAATTYNTRLTSPSAVSPGFLRRNVGAYSPGQLVTTGAQRTSVCYYSFTDPSGAPAVMARVHVEYSHPLFIPLISQILDGFDGANDGGYRLGVTEEIRVANTPLTTTDIGNSGSPTCNP